MTAAELDTVKPGEMFDLYDEWREEQGRRDFRSGAIVQALTGTNPADIFPTLAEMRPTPPDEKTLESKIDRVLGAKG